MFDFFQAEFPPSASIQYVPTISDTLFAYLSLRLKQKLNGVVVCNGKTAPCVGGLDVCSVSDWHSGPVILNTVLQVYSLHLHRKPRESVERAQD